MHVRRIAIVMTGCCLAAVAATLGASPARADSTPTNTKPESGPGTVATAKVVSVSFGKHATFDRVVIAFDRGVPPWSVERIMAGKGKHGYVDGAFGGVPSDPKDRLQWLQIAVHADVGDLTDYRPGLASIPNASLEGHEPDNGALFIPMATTLPFHLFTLSSPARLVIDIAQPAAPVAQPVPAQSGQLPFTGSGVGWLALAGGLLVMTGGGLLFATRLRPQPMAPRGVA